MSTTQKTDCSVTGVLCVSLELGKKQWKVASGCSIEQRPRVRNLAGGDVKALLDEVRRAKKRFGVSEDTDVLSCYEAGRDGFWLHRCLELAGITNIVVDSASLARSRRRGAAKTDRTDAEALLRLLMRRAMGEKGACRVVRVPSQEDEDARHLPRELATLKADRTRHSNRIQSHLMTQGVRGVSLRSGFAERLAKVRRWDGSALPAGLQRRILQEYECFIQVGAQIKELEKERRAALKQASSASMECARRLMQLKGIGVNGGTVLALELFGWRKFRNRRQLGALVGLVPGVTQSGDLTRDSAITRSGSPALRALMVELAWCWLRFQPDSDLSRWYDRRFAKGSTRLRKIGIVALARKLLIDLWRYLETGALPDGAELKAC